MENQFRQKSGKLMRSFEFYFFAISILLSFSACKKQESSHQLTGTYTGSFYYGQNQPVNDVSLIMDETSFHLLGKGVPAGGSGIYKIVGKHILFKDMNLWSADFDWGLRMDGQFEFHIKGDSLILTKSDIACSECSSIRPLTQYRLKKTH